MESETVVVACISDYLGRGTQVELHWEHLTWILMNTITVHFFDSGNFLKNVLHHIELNLEKDGV